MYIYWKNAGLLWGALAFSGVIAPVRADVVAEWKFDGASSLTGGAMVSLDTVAPGASTQSKLQADTSFKTDATGLSAAWAPFLQKGFIDVASETGDAGKNKVGLVTQDDPAGSKNSEFRKYLGFSGINADHAGSVCLVVSPDTDWTAPTRRGLFSTGHVIDGMISLAIQKTGQLDFRVGGKKVKFVDAVLTRTWEPGKWYFIGASWQGDKPAVLVVYEMTPDPKASVVKVDTAVSTDACPDCEQPRFDPLTVGATWYNTGGEAATNDGADARIAYVRVDNTAADEPAFKAILTGLAAAPSSAATTSTAPAATASAAPAAAPTPAPAPKP